MQTMQTTRMPVINGKDYSIGTLEHVHSFTMNKLQLPVPCYCIVNFNHRHKLIVESPPPR